jgi:hypothetical protein
MRITVPGLHTSVTVIEFGQCTMENSIKYRLTLDTSLTKDASQIPAMGVLQRWKSEGKVDFLEASPEVKEVYGWPGAAPVPPGQRDFDGKRRHFKKQPTVGGVNFKSIAAVLFPHRPSDKLDMGEINQVAHLIKHHGNKNEIFVTKNTVSYIEGGRRERLKSSFGILVMTPEDTVQMLSEMESWK